jgi:glycosyltransferase involved in cell wall biosynthesis
MTENQIRVGVFHPGTQHSWQTSRAFQDRNRLAWYATSIFWTPERFPYTLLPWLPKGITERITSEVRRFYHPDLNSDLVYTFNGTEWSMRVAHRLGFRRLAKALHGHSNIAFSRPVTRLLKKDPVGIVWGYDQSSLEVFREARSLGIKTLLDRTIGHPAVYNNLMDSIYEKYSEFFPSPQYRIDQRLIDRADEEHELATAILVGSAFCASTLHGKLSPTKEPAVRVVPYCFDDVFFSGGQARHVRGKGPVRFLFLGQAGPRKGIHLVLRAFEKIPKSAATLTIVGELQVPPKTFARYADRVNYYPTVPRPDVRRFMAEADCLVFPSYFEGAAISVYEAMAMGLSIIQSKHTDIMVEPDSPLLMHELSEEELLRCVNYVIQNRSIIEEESSKALAKASNYTYEAYSRRLNEIIVDV